jgi:hypothetical protein
MTTWTTTIDPIFRLQQQRMHAIQKEIYNQLASTTTCKSSIKTSNFHWIPLYYHILLLPDFDAKKVHSVNSDLEMKINYSNIL